MASLRRVAELNNSGASMLVAARDKEAFKTLQTALTVMEQEMLEEPDETESSVSKGFTSSTTSFSESERQASRACSSAHASASEEIASNDDGSAACFRIDARFSTDIPELKDDRYFIFNQALLVEIKDTTVSSSSNFSSEAASESSLAGEDLQSHSYCLVCFYASVVIYNLALAYHKKGMVAAARSSTGAAPTTTDDSRLALSQSLRLYEHCLRIARSIADWSEDCKMLLYAVSCNLAHLYCRKGDRSRAQELLNGLEEANHLSYQNRI